MKSFSTFAIGLALAFAPAAAADPATEVEAIENELAELESRMETLRARLDEALRDKEPSRAFGGFDKFRDDALAGDDGERRVHRMIEDPEALRDVARNVEQALEDADIFVSLADLMIAFSEDVVIVEEDDSVTLSFKGRDMATVEADGEDRMTLRAMGRKLTVEVE